jgi:hypothetical protein
MPAAATIAYALLIIVAIVLNAYTMRFQGATLFWGKAIAPHNPLLPRGMQDAITPSWQTARNLLNWPLLFVVFVGGAWLHAWYVGLGAVAAAWFGSALVAVLLLPGYSSPFWFKRILRTLRQSRSPIQRVK